MNIRRSFSKVANNISHSSNGRTIMANFFSLSMLQIVGYVFPLVTLPYLSRVVGVKHFGEIAFATAVINYFQTFVDWGYNFIATRDLARIKENTRESSVIYSTVFWSRMFLCFISLCIITILVLTVPIFKSVSILLYFRFILILGYLFYADWFFQAIEKMKYMTIFNILANIVFTVSVFVVIRDKDDYIFQPLLQSMGFFISGMLAFFFVVPRYGIRLCRVSMKEVLFSLRRSFNVFINQLMPIAYENITVLLLGFLGGAAANGKFDAGNKIVQAIDRLVRMMARAFFPYLARHIEKHSFYVKLNLVFSFLVSCCLFFSAPFIIDLLFSPEFVDAVVILRIVSISIVFSTLINAYGTNYLILKGCDRQLRNITMVVSAFGILLAILLISKYSFIGAAVTLVATKAILGISITVISIKEKRKELSI